MSDATKDQMLEALNLAAGALVVAMEKHGDPASLDPLALDILTGFQRVNDARKRLRESMRGTP